MLKPVPVLPTSSLGNQPVRKVSAAALGRSLNDDDGRQKQNADSDSSPTTHGSLGVSEHDARGTPSFPVVRVTLFPPIPQPEVHGHGVGPSAAFALTCSGLVLFCLMCLPNGEQI